MTMWSRTRTPTSLPTSRSPRSLAVLVSDHRSDRAITHLADPEHRHRPQRPPHNRQHRKGDKHGLLTPHPRAARHNAHPRNQHDTHRRQKRLRLLLVGACRRDCAAAPQQTGPATAVCHTAKGRRILPHAVRNDPPRLICRPHVRCRAAMRISCAPLRCHAIPAST